MNLTGAFMFPIKSKADELALRFGHIATELAEAKIHITIYEQLESKKSEFSKEFNHSLDFWERTKTAHLLTSLIGLCRVYDNNRDPKQRVDRDPFHLLRFVEEIGTLSGSIFSVKERKRQNCHLNFLRNNKQVLKLRKWRNGVICHRNQSLLLGGRENFLVQCNLSLEDVKNLIEKAAKIYARWAEHCKINYPIPRLNGIENQILFVLQSLKRDSIQR